MKQKNILLYSLFAYGSLLYSMDDKTIKEMETARINSLKRYRASRFYRREKEEHKARISSKRPINKAEEKRLEYDNALYKDAITKEDIMLLIRG